MTPIWLVTSIEMTVAAGSTDERYVTPPAPAGEWKAKKILFTPATAVAVHGSNYATLTIYGADDSTALASFTTNSSGGAALVLGTVKDLSITAGKNGEFTALTDDMKIAKTEAGTGAAIDGNLQILWERVS